MDISKIKARLESLSNKNQKTKALWKPDPKQVSVIRIVPYKKDTSNPFIELYFHYGINNKNYLSPHSFGRPDPFIEFADKLKKKGDKENWKLGKSFEPKLRTYVPIIVRGKENEGVKYWGFGKTVYESILSIIADEDYGDITDPISGRDISVKYIESNNGQEFAKTELIVKPKQTPMTNDPEILKLIKEQPDILDIFEEPSYDELTEALKKYLDPSSDESEEDDNNDIDELTEMKSSDSGDDVNVEEKPKTAKKVDNDDLEKQFADLFN